MTLPHILINGGSWPILVSRITVLLKNKARYIMEFKKDASPPEDDPDQDIIIYEHLISESGSKYATGQPTQDC